MTTLSLVESVTSQSVVDVKNLGPDNEGIATAVAQVSDRIPQDNIPGIESGLSQMHHRQAVDAQSVASLDEISVPTIGTPNGHAKER